MAEAMNNQDLAVRVQDTEGQERVRLVPVARLASLSETPALLAELGLTQARPALPPVIGDLSPGGAAEVAGLRRDDLVIAVDGEPVATWQAWVDLIRQHPEQNLEVRVRRGADEVDLRVTPRRQVEEGASIGKIGAAPQIPEDLFSDYRTLVRLGPLEAIPAATAKTLDISCLMLRVV
jgi:regulator of sigma E protease